MKKIFLLITAFLFFIIPVQSQVNDVNNDIQKDEVRVDQFIDTEQTNVEEITGEHIKSFNSNITINKDGTINVKETIVYDFGDIYKHGIYRKIQTIKTNQDGKKYKMDVQGMSVVDENGNWYKYEPIGSDAQLEFKIGDPNITIAGVHTYVISYLVSGALTYFSDHDELYWNVTGNEWVVPIASTTGSVVWPQKLQDNELKAQCFTGNLGSSEKNCVFTINQDSSVFGTNNRLEAGQGLTIVVSFPKNIVAVLEPKEFVSFWNTFVGKLVSLMLGLLALIWYVGLPFFVIYKWFKSGRDPKGTVGVTSAWFDPPKTQDGKRFFTPGEVGTLGDETVDIKDISATIVDLARRGYLVIDEKKKGDFYFIKGKKFNNNGELLLFEKELLSGIFNTGDDIVKLKGKNLSETVSDVKNKLYELVVEDKLFDKNPQITRTIYYVIAGIALFTGNFFLAIIAFLFGRVMPRKTVFGVEAKNIAFSLKNFLGSQQRQLEFQADKQMMFEKLLPYAIAFGVERIWAKRFESIDLQQPSWYRGYSSANFSSYLLISSLSSSFRSINAAATPTRSSSGFSSGFGGGGFSGGGGGGGGGGSW